MSRIYGIAATNSNVQYSNYNSALQFAPYNTNRFPAALPYHSYGVLKGIRPTPPQFYPGQEPVYASQNTNARAIYFRATGIRPHPHAEKNLSTTTSYSFSGETYHPVSTHMNYISPIPSSMRTTQLKSVAVGKTAYPTGIITTSTKNYEPSFTRTCIQRARNGGCTAPKKKGSIYNTSLRNPQASNWGTLPRQNYS
jgi:hypothetical protein